MLELVFKYTPQDFIKNSEFKIGERVRIKNKKDTFSNQYKNNWSREICIINRINTDPDIDNIKDLNNKEIKHNFYEYETK